MLLDFLWQQKSLWDNDICTSTFCILGSSSGKRGSEMAHAFASSDTSDQAYPHSASLTERLDLVPQHYFRVSEVGLISWSHCFRQRNNHLRMLLWVATLAVATREQLKEVWKFYIISDLRRISCAVTTTEIHLFYKTLKRIFVFSEFYGQLELFRN
jgi:hypothetical protein